MFTTSDGIRTRRSARSATISSMSTRLSSQSRALPRTDCSPSRSLHRLLRLPSSRPR
jgi:hypothetical protein